MSHDLSCDYAIKLWLMWQRDQLTLTLVVLKIENRKKIENKNKNKKKKNKSSPPSSILTSTIEDWVFVRFWQRITLL